MDANFDLGFNFDENSNESEAHRFGNSTTNEQCELLDDRNRDSTKRATKNMIKILTDYLKEKKKPELNQIRDDELPDLLFEFYTNLKKAKGGDCKLQSLKCIRAGINRYMKAERNVDIINDTKFARTNEMFKAVTTRAKKSGLGSTKSTPPIEPEDLEKLAEFFHHDFMHQPDPKLLQRVVLFNIIYFFCRRGRQNIYKFTQDMFEIGYDPDGTQYVFQSKDEMDKNHGIDETLPANDGRMYEQADSLLCPVATFKLYKSKLNPDVPFFWQRAKHGKIHYCSPRWYDRVRVGHDLIESFMSTLSKDANLSKRYTNHSIRSTVMGILTNKYEGRIVIGLSGHKSENTIKQYVRVLPAKTKREMCGTLADNLQAKKAKQSETISKPPEEEVVSIALDEPNPPNVQYELQLLDDVDAPSDEALVNLLASIENQPNAENTPANQQVAVPDKVNLSIQPAQPANNTMNIQNIQNINPAKFLPAMVFPHSNVTINYNFGKQ